MLPDAGVLVHGDGLRHVLLQDCVIVVGFWFLVEILINIFLWIVVRISFYLVLKIILKEKYPEIMSVMSWSVFLERN